MDWEAYCACVLDAVRAMLDATDDDKEYQRVRLSESSLSPAQRLETSLNYEALTPREDHPPSAITTRWRKAAGDTIRCGTIVEASAHEVLITLAVVPRAISLFLKIDPANYERRVGES